MLVYLIGEVRNMHNSLQAENRQIYHLIGVLSRVCQTKRKNYSYQRYSRSLNYSKRTGESCSPCKTKKTVLSARKNSVKKVSVYHSKQKMPKVTLAKDRVKRRLIL